MRASAANEGGSEGVRDSVRVGKRGKELVEAPPSVATRELLCRIALACDDLLAVG